VRPDGRLEAQAIPLGTNTGRYAHRQIVNVPAVGTLYGEEIRSLLIASEGYVISGTDASGLEARVAGHYTYPYDGGAFARELMEGDIHSKNAAVFSAAAGKEISRRAAKTIYYAILYGAKARKVATQVGVSVEVGAAMLEAFWQANPAMAALVADTVTHAERYGWVPGLDGRKIMIRSPHSALNAMFQSAGAIIMKNCFNKVLLGSDLWHCVCTMHDEAQVEVPPDAANYLKQQWVFAGEWVTDKFHLNVPIEFDTKVGLNYAQTH
jgi:DNA polymerase I-like protein with 3'-5' exonuclease and polymerase domains